MVKMLRFDKNKQDKTKYQLSDTNAVQKVSFSKFIFKTCFMPKIDGKYVYDTIIEEFLQKMCKVVFL